MVREGKKGNQPGDRGKSAATAATITPQRPQSYDNPRQCNWSEQTVKHIE